MTTYHLALDNNFIPYSHELIQYESFVFSGGEPHIRIKTEIQEVDSVCISHRINSFNDLGMLCVAVDALRRMRVKTMEAFIPYFPAARQDRVMITGEALTVKIYAQIINALRLDKVVLFDPHSEVTPALLDSVAVIPNHDFIQQVLDEIKEPVALISPDGGALKKIYKLSEALRQKDVVECSKHRNVETGKLTDFKVGKDDLNGKPCLIVDDICDGGSTFLGLAEELRKKNAGKLYLAISHGIFSKGLDVLAEDFDRIFCTDSIRTIEHEKLTQIKLKI